jgi:ribosomal protein S18 acetylase RimI-like enzyme
MTTPGSVTVEVRIRPARTADVPVLEGIVEHAYGVYVERIGGRPGPMDADYEEKVRAGDVFVAEEDGVVGLIVLVAKPDHVLIENVAVDPRRQGTGIGRLLLSFAETFAHEHQLSVLRLYTNSAMRENLALYERLGYKEDERRTENGFERVFLSKQLDPRVRMKAIGIEFIEAFNRRDIDALVGLVSPDFEFHPTSLVGERRVYEGHDGLRRWAGELSESQLKHQARLREIRVLDENRFLALTEVLLDGELVSPSAMLAHIDAAGRIVEAHAYLSDEEMLIKIGVVPKRTQEC